MKTIGLIGGMSWEALSINVYSNKKKRILSVECHS